MATEKNSVKCVWGDAFESIKSVKDNTYDQIFVDLNDDQFCIDLACLLYTSDAADEV